MKTLRHLSLLLAAVTALTASVIRAESELHSLTEIKAFVADLTPRRVPFKLTGKVLSVHRGPRAVEVILSDDANVRGQFFISDPTVVPPNPGDTIEAVGLARLGENQEHYMRLDGFTTRQQGNRPRPTDVPLYATDTEQHHLLTIRTEGTVIDTFPDEVDRRYDILLLKDRSTVIPVSLFREVFGDCQNLIDARIRITGVYHQFIGGARKFAWPCILPHTQDELEVLTPPPADPFSAPVLESRLYLTQAEVSRMPKRSVTGEVLAVWSTDQVMLRDRGGRTVNLTLANGIELPRYGETIVAVGLPETDLYRLNLAAVRWKSAAAQIPPQSDETPKTLDDVTFSFTDENGPSSIMGEVYGTLLTIRGIVRTLPSATDAQRFVLDANRREILVDVSSVPDAPALEIGSEIRVSGRGILLTDRGNRVFDSSKVKGLALIVRTPGDIALLSRPPWWTTTKLLVLIAILLLALVVVAVRNRILRHLARLKISERTRLSVELHDTLSQNLTGVAFQVASIGSAIDKDPEAAKSRVKISVEMLQSCRTELKQCLFDLRSDMLEEPDFPAAIRVALSQLKNATSVAIRFNVRRARFSDPVAHTILCIIRELTANAIRHGKASHVRIAGSTEDGLLKFSVSDNGCGFDPERCDGTVEGHFGLTGIRDRLDRLNGKITFVSAPDKGTKATVIVPMTVA